MEKIEIVKKIVEKKIEITEIQRKITYSGKNYSGKKVEKSGKKQIVQNKYRQWEKIYRQWKKYRWWKKNIYSEKYKQLKKRNKY